MQQAAYRLYFIWPAIGLMLVCVLLVTGCASAPAAQAGGTTPPPGDAQALVPLSEQEQRYGIRYQSLRLSGSGLLLDFRYKVLDPGKAAQVVNRQARPYVTDPETGHQFQVPHAQKIGTLRHMGGNLQAGRVYSMLFANPGRTIKSGAKVNVVVGDYHLDGLTVE